MKFIGEMKTPIIGGQIVKLSCDAIRETKTITGHSAFVTIFAYNSADLPTSMTYPDGEVVGYEYNARMMLDTVIGNSIYVSDTQYDSAGRMTSRALGNGLTQTYGYYDWNEKVNNIGQGGRLETLVTGSLQNLSYVYDKVGNVKQITNSLAGETSVYGYDELNRLTSWQLNQNPVKNYSYDSAGNLDVKNGLDLNYYDTNHVHAVTHIGSTQKYWYDDNGNQTTRVYGADTYTQIYDAEDRMVEVKKNNVTMAEFTYNGDGQRVKSVMGGETTYFVNGYYEKKGSEITKYYPGGAVRKYVIPQSMSVEYILGDHLGSASVTTDSNGTKVSEMRYSPWGEVRYHWVDSNLSTTPSYTLPKLTFTGQYSYMDDPSTQGAVEGFGLMFYNARWYDPQVGRFAQADTLVPNNIHGLDRYMYVNNSPVRYIDPSGHDAWWCETASCRYRYYTSLNPNYFTGGELEYIKQYLEYYYGITLSDAGADSTDKDFEDSKPRKWDLANARQIDLALSNINSALNQHLRTITGNTNFIFTLNTRPGAKYSGETNGQRIDFYTNTTIPLQNIYHEFGHALNSLPNKDNIFSNQIVGSPSYIKNGYLNPEALKLEFIPGDPIWGDVEALQASGGNVLEQWADIFANYVAGNIDRSDPSGPGEAMYTFITGVFAPYNTIPE